MACCGASPKREAYGGYTHFLSSGTSNFFLFFFFGGGETSLVVNKRGAVLRRFPREAYGMHGDTTGPCANARVGPPKKQP